MSYITMYIADEYLLSRLSYKRYFENFSQFKILGDFSEVENLLISMQKKPADVVLMDINLPKMNGIEVINLITRNFPKTKIIISTTYKDERKILASLANGASACIVKNEIKSLSKIIEIVMQGGFWMNLDMAHNAFSSIPELDNNDLENSYENERLKNCLTTRELEVLKLLTDGKTNNEIAAEIIISTNTAKAHVGNILTKLEVSDRVQAAVKAVRAKLF